jgi:peptidylprolyl isomerase
VRYTGSLNNGTEFDKVGPGEKPISFKLGRRQVIQGWDDGLVGMRVGGRRQLVIPPDLGYGQERSGKIPGDATLVFVIEIISAKY